MIYGNVYKQAIAYCRYALEQWEKTVLRQLLYINSSRPRGSKADVANILEQSRRNNARDGVTGLLWTDGIRFLQVLEGESRSVDATYTRIGNDPRHQAIVILSDRHVAQREFGDWSMAHATRAEDQDQYRARVERLLSGASEEVRHTFLGLIEARARMV